MTATLATLLLLVSHVATPEAETRERLCSLDTREATWGNDPDALQLKGLLEFDDFCYRIEVPEELVAFTSKAQPGRGFGAFARGSVHSYFGVHSDPNSLEFAGSEEYIQSAVKFWSQFASEVYPVEREILDGLDARRFSMEYRCPPSTDYLKFTMIGALSPNGVMIFTFVAYGPASNSQATEKLLRSLTGSFHLSTRVRRCQEACVDKN